MAWFVLLAAYSTTATHWKAIYYVEVFSTITN